MTSNALVQQQTQNLSAVVVTVVLVRVLTDHNRTQQRWRTVVVDRRYVGAVLEQHSHCLDATLDARPDERRVC
jgi:hypothetical protein